MGNEARWWVRARGALGCAAIAGLGMGCSTNPLVGTWSTAFTVGSSTLTDTLDLSSDGTLSVAISNGSPSCSGAWDVAGLTWTATAASGADSGTIAVSGTPDCTGSITCGAVSVSCAEENLEFKAGSCTYTLSSDDDTLALTACTGTPDGTFTRQD